MRRRASLIVAALALAGRAEAARPVPYGGALEARAFAAPLALTSRDARAVADRVAARAMFEPLYRLEGDRLAPVLASGPPQIEGPLVRVPLRPGLRLHDGRPLTPALVAAALRERVRGPGAHVVMPVVGFRAARGSARPESLRIEAEPGAVTLRLRAPYPEFPRLLASAHAGVGVRSPTARREVGTGPFAFDSQTRGGGVRLVAFDRHRSGRPYLDRFVVEVTASRSYAAGWARRADAGVLLTLPAGLSRAEPRPGAPAHRVIVRVGDRPDRAAWVAAIEGALGRARLARRFLGPHARPQDRLLDGLPPLPPPAPGATPTFAPTRLLVSQADPAGWQFAKRVQLDLLRAGISATLDRLPPDALASRAAAPERDLVLTHVLPDAPATPDPQDRLHALMSIAAALGQPDALPVEAWDAAATAPPEQRAARLAALEARLRAALGVVVIAHRPIATEVRGDVAGLAWGALGALDAAAAYRVPE